MLRLVVFTVVFANFLNMFLHPCKPRYYCSCGQIDMLFCAVLWGKWVQMGVSSEKALWRVPPNCSLLHLSPRFFCGLLARTAVASEKVLWL